MFKKFLRKNAPSPVRGGDFAEGKRLFELGVAAAHRDNFIEAQKFYTQSIEACPNPVPYLNRGRILVKQLRHYDALNDFQNALRCDLEQGNEFVDEIKGEIQSVQFFTELYRDGTREKLIADYDTQDDIMYVARRVFCTSFKVKADGFAPYNSPLVQFHFFNEIDNIARFDDLSLYPEVAEFLDIYPAAFVRKMVDAQVDNEAYLVAESILHRFLCAYDEKRMRYLRRHMLYDIHQRLLDRDYGAMGHSTMDAEPNSHIIREAADWLSLSAAGEHDQSLPPKENQLFNIFKKKPVSTITALGKTAVVVSITRNGKILYTDDTVKGYPKDHLEGKVFEVSFPTQTGNPYFAYYLCDEYYGEVTNPNIQGTVQMAMGTSKFRSEVSEKIGLFLVQYLKSAYRIDASKEIVSFSHNRAHTNVLAYIEALDDWFPVQHCDAEGDDASELKARMVNDGTLSVSQVMAVSGLSPTG